MKRHLGPPTIREELRDPVVIFMIVLFLLMIAPLFMWAGSAVAAPPPRAHHVERIHSVKVRVDPNAAAVAAAFAHAQDAIRAQQAMDDQRHQEILRQAAIEESYAAELAATS